MTDRMWNGIGVSLMIVAIYLRAIGRYFNQRVELKVRYTLWQAVAIITLAIITVSIIGGLYVTRLWGC